MALYNVLMSLGVVVLIGILLKGFWGALASSLWSSPTTHKATVFRRHNRSCLYPLDPQEAIGGRADLSNASTAGEP